MHQAATCNIRSFYMTAFRAERGIFIELRQMKVCSGALSKRLMKFARNANVRHPAINVSVTTTIRTGIPCWTELRERHSWSTICNTSISTQNYAISPTFFLKLASRTIAPYIYKMLPRRLIRGHLCLMAFSSVYFKQNKDRGIRRYLQTKITLSALVSLKISA